VLRPEAGQEGRIRIEHGYIQGAEGDYEPGEKDQKAGDAQHE